MPGDTPSHGSDLATVAAHLAENRNRITVEWMDAVRDDSQIPAADRLTRTALEDHFPDMLDELIAGLKRPDQEVDGMETRETGAEHGKARWRSGYRLDEVLRELARIREIVLRHATDFAGEHLSPAVNEEAGETIRHFFDSIVATSARHFIQEQEAEVLLRSRQLQNAYEQVQAATEELRELSQSRLRLLRTVSHELRNSLNAVNLAAHSLLEESSPIERQTLGASLARSVGRLQSLLDRLRDFSEILAGQSRPELHSVNLAEFLRELEVRHRPQVERNGLRFETYFMMEDPIVTSDEGKLREIAGNLLSNAVNYTKEGSISVSLLGAGPDRWILRVEDTGLGISPTESRHIFSEFHYGLGESHHRGIGLGLPITRHLVHLLGGEITFESIEGKGSKFEVNLPRVVVAG